MTEIVAWMIGCGIVAAVLTAGAWAWEKGARWSGRPARWAWLGALGGSVVLPFLLRLVPGERWEEAMPAVGVVRLEELAVAGGEASSAAGVGALAIVVWMVLSAAIVAYGAVLLVRLAHARRGWRVSELDGATVLVSRDTGPAALGVRRGVVVIPAWALELEAELRRLMLLHEREHVQAGDPRVLLGALALLAVMPWHPLVWLQFLRLRNAIELDCDARVLRRGVNPARYGSLLLEIGERRGGNALVLATFAEPRALLEQRIRRIAEWPLRRSPVRAALLSVVALALFSTALLARVRVESVGSAVAGQGSALQKLGLAGETGAVPALVVDTPPPTRTVRPDPRQTPPGQQPVESQAAEISDAPTFTPMTQRPELVNQRDVQHALITNYPPVLRDAGIGGSAVIWFHIDESGQVRKTQLSKSSGYPALDEAAQRVAEMMRFSPAQNRGKTVAVWVEIPILFGAREPAAGNIAASGERVRLPAPSSEASVPTGERPRMEERRLAPSSSAPPEFTPMTKRPELRNQVEVQHALIRSYPPLLRDAGIGGTAWIWFFIDREGSVTRLQLSKSSGYPALDQAALSVAAMMQFTPARNRDEVAAVWVEIPILFSAK